MPPFFFQSIQSPKKATGDLHGDHAITGFNIDLPKDFERPHQPINPHGLSAGSWGKFPGFPKEADPCLDRDNFSGTFTQSHEGLAKQIRNKMMIFRLHAFFVFSSRMIFVPSGSAFWWISQ